MVFRPCFGAASHSYRHRAGQSSNFARPSPKWLVQCTISIPTRSPGQRVPCARPPLIIRWAMNGTMQTRQRWLCARGLLICLAWKLNRAGFAGG